MEHRYRGAKWLTEYLPTTNYKLSQLDKLFLSVLETVKKIIGDNSVSIQYVLPHFVKAGENVFYTILLSIVLSCL